MGSAAQRAVLAAAVLCARLFDGIRRSELCETPTAAGPPPHPPRPGCHFPPRAAASSQPSERGRHQREGGASLLSPRSARVTTQIASCPPQEGSGVSSAVTRRRGRHRIKGQSAQVPGGYLVSPAQLGICSSLSSQNVVIVSGVAGEFLKRESKSSGWIQ